MCIFAEIFKISIMKNVNKFSLFAILVALLFVQPLFGDNIPTEGTWGDERYRTIVPQPPVVSVEGNLLSLTFRSGLSDLRVCVLDCNGVKVHEEVVSSEAGATYSISLAGKKSGQYQIVLLHELGHLAGDFTLE